MRHFVLAFALISTVACGALDTKYLPPIPGPQRPQPFSHNGDVGGPIHPDPIHPGPHGQVKPPVPILRYENNNDGEGNYQWAYESADGTVAQEQGILKNIGTPDEGPSAQGSFEYMSPEGHLISLVYTADENGFLPSGAHLPTPPPIPEEILRSIEQNEADEARGIIDDGQYRPEHDEIQSKYSPQQYIPPPQVPHQGQQEGYKY